MKTDRTLLRFGALPALLLITACGDTDNPAAAVTYDSLSSEFLLLEQSITIGDLGDVYAPEDLPTEGDTTYNGVLQFVIEADAINATEDLIVVGDLNVTADFLNSGMSGSVTNFANDARESYDGMVTISNGTILRDNDPSTTETFSASASGNLTHETDGLDLAVSGLLVGDFYGNFYENIGGTFRGTVNTTEGLLEFDDRLPDANSDGTSEFLATR